MPKKTIFQRLNNPDIHSFDDFIYDNDAPQISISVCCAAWDIWLYCHNGNEATAEPDFSLYSCGEFGALFGGVNRVKWQPLAGWSADPTKCTPEFLQRFNELKSSNFNLDGV